MAASATTAGDVRWDSRWRRQRQVVLTEPAGIDRDAEIVELRMDFASASVDDVRRELRVVAVRPGADGVEYVEVPSQLFNASAYYNGVGGTVVFAADVPANGTATYLVCHDAPDAATPDYRTDLAVTEPTSGLNWRVDTDWFSLALDERSGQIRSMLQHATGMTLAGEALTKPVDYSPDVVPKMDGRGYNGPRHWNGPDGEVDHGPVVFAMSRRGPLDQPANNGEPGIDEVEASVNYRVFAGQPYYLHSTTLTMVQDIELHSMRNGSELAFLGNPYTHALWEGDDGEVMAVELDSFDPAVLEDVDNGFRGDWIPATTPWFSFVNLGTGDGVAVIYLEYGNLGPRSLDGRAPLHNERIYVVGGPGDKEPGDYYFRAPIWEHALQDPERAPATLVPRGSIYYEFNAVLPYRLDEARMPSAVQRWSERLRHPLRATYQDSDERDLRDQPADPRPGRPFAEFLS
jgi:hypothetical protein